MQHTIYIINRVPSPILLNKSPFSIVFKTNPDLSSLRIFGLLCFVCTKKANRSKFDDKSRKCVFLGFPTDTKGYKVSDLKERQYLTLRDIIFCENKFPYIDDQDEETQELSLSVADANLEPYELDLSSSITQSNFQNITASILEDSLLADTTLLPSENIVSNSSYLRPQPRRTTRTSKVPSHLEGYDCPTLQQKTPLKHTSPHLLSNVISYENVSPKHQVFFVALSSYKEPTIIRKL